MERRGFFAALAGLFALFAAPVAKRPTIYEFAAAKLTANGAWITIDGRLNPGDTTLISTGPGSDAVYRELGITALPYPRTA